MIYGILALVFGIWCWMRLFTRYPERSIRDVYPFFYYIEGEILIGSFHPEPEQAYRTANTSTEFRKWQIRRVHLAIHLCRHISANCHLLQEWTTYERKLNWEAHSEPVRVGLREFQVRCMRARTAAFAIRFRLLLWLMRMHMLPMLPVPSFRSLVDHSNRLIESYGAAETLVETLSLLYGEEIHENMVAVLGMVELESDEPEG